MSSVSNILDDMRQVMRRRHYSIRTEQTYCGTGSELFLPHYCFKIITYRLVTPRILFFCIAATIPALKRSADMGA